MPAINRSTAIPITCGDSAKPGVVANLGEDNSECMSLSPDVEELIPLRILCFSPSSFNCKFSDRIEASSSLKRLFSSISFFTSSPFSGTETSSAILCNQFNQNFDQLMLLKNSKNKAIDKKQCSYSSVNPIFMYFSTFISDEID